MNKRPVFMAKDHCYTFDSKGHKILASKEDYDLLLRSTWSSDHGYPTSEFKTVRNRLHQIVQQRIGFSGLCDHINRNPLDNRRENLRSATDEVNAQNHSMQKNNTSGFIGVSYARHAKKYRAMITFNSKQKHLGYFHDIIEAAKAYDRAALKYHGSHSTTNKSLGNL